MIVIKSYVLEIIQIEGKASTIKTRIAAKLPYAVKDIASYPCPFFNNSCPGRTESSVSVSGQPRKIEGIKSRKVCVIAIATINTARYIGFREKKRVAERVIKKAPTRFMCIPGIRPVMVPKIIPINKKSKISISIG